MEKNTDLTALLAKIAPQGEVVQGNQFPELTISAGQLFEIAEKLKNCKEVPFDFLMDLTAIDFETKFTVVYHLESTKTHDVVVLRTDLPDRNHAEVETVSGLWPAAEFMEREVFDLFGIRFKNHHDLRRLFMEDDYGHPLRKDFKDDINLIEYPN